MTSDFKGLYDVRDAKAEDYNFVLATFLRGLYHGDSWFSLIPRRVFMENYQKVAELLLKRHMVKVACLKDEPDVILGYSILSNDYSTVHFVYVKSAWRRKGIGRSLVPERPTAVTHLTKTGAELLNKIPTAIFDPFKI